MTYDDFLTQLRQTPRDWSVDEDGYLRRSASWNRYSYQCPISSLHGTAASHFTSVASSLGLDDTLAMEIAEAADNDEGHDPAIRRDLLAATGLA